MSLVVVRAIGLVTIQDLGRHGHMHEAVPPGGALVGELLAVANRRARNAEGVPAVEVLGTLVVRADAEVVVATDTAPARRLRVGEELTVTSEPRRVGYLAMRGGVDAPLILDGRGALLSAGLGALVRAGTRLATAEHPEVAPAGDEPVVEARPIRVIDGPDPEAFTAAALDVLASAAYRILPSSDRVGTRIAGLPIPRVAGYPETSRPMVVGALEVPADGMPIVLGPEHPTTGGYPILAVIAHADLGRFFAIRLGGTVRFTRR